MEKEFLPYEQALALKELGFDEPCFGRYIYDGRGKEWFLVQTQQTKSASVIFEGARSVDGISVAAPLYQQAFRWFREKCNLFCEIQIDRTTEPKFCFDIFQYEHFGNYEKIEVEEWYLYRTQEEVELECLKELIRIV
jgi:hypothetical protein